MPDPTPTPEPSGESAPRGAALSRHAERRGPTKPKRRRHRVHYYTGPCRLCGEPLKDKPCSPRWDDWRVYCEECE